MNVFDGFRMLGPLDIAGVALLTIGWFAIGWLIENPNGKRRSVSLLMREYRNDWMRELVSRQPRVFDSAILSTMRQGTTFFASSCLLAIGGGLAVIGNPGPLSDVAGDLTLERAPEVVWEIKILLILIFLVTAFLRFVWSHRLFGYCAVLMASVPNDPDDPVAQPRAIKAADINVLAARSFNSGMRAIYFALGATAWLAGSLGLILGTCAILMLIWRREFASHSRDVLLRDDI